MGYIMIICFIYSVYKGQLRTICILTSLNIHKKIHEHAKRKRNLNSSQNFESWKRSSEFSGGRERAQWSSEYGSQHPHWEF